MMNKIKKRSLKKWLKIIFWTFIISAGVFFGVLYYGYRELEKPQCVLQNPIRVEIPPGTRLKEVLAILQQRGILQRPFLVEVLFRWHRTDRRIKAGLYEFQGSLNSWDIYRLLLNGQVITRTLTFVEGWDRWDIVDYLANEGIAARETALGAFRDPQFLSVIQKLDPEATDLEGYLFPDTYRFREPVTLQQVFQKLLRRFLYHWNKKRATTASLKGWTVRQVVILASLVEKETSIPEERPLVASVFINRLKIGMRLECDPTVIYAWKLNGRNPIPLTRADLEIDSPYNTYRYKGLPPGPIANPGLASIDAVLWAPETRYLYFVADGKGGHRFSTNYREHLRNVRQYRQRR